VQRPAARWHLSPIESSFLASQLRNDLFDVALVNQLSCIRLPNAFFDQLDVILVQIKLVVHGLVEQVTTIAVVHGRQRV
jgi:hypothetical protein